MRILLGSYFVRYPLGGNQSWTVQWAVALARLGHDVWLVEKATYPNACFDPHKRHLTDDPAAGMASSQRLIESLGLGGRLVYVDRQGGHHGAAAGVLAELFGTADLFVDLGNHGAWHEEAEAAGVRTAVVEGEPLYTQLKWKGRCSTGAGIPRYDTYFTNGANIGGADCDVPTLDVKWQHVFNPVVPDLFPAPVGSPDASFTTVMNWQSHPPFTFEGRTYGQKDVEFEKFRDLPAQPGVGALEMAVTNHAPLESLNARGWRTTDALEASQSFDHFRSYIADSAGEFSVCKEGYVAGRTGWFSDRSAAYLASGRPVVMQDTGLAEVLPSGRGFFAVSTVDEAAEAIRTIRGDYARQSMWARDLAGTYLESGKVLTRFLEQAL